MDSRKTAHRDLHRCDFCGYASKSLFTILKHQRQHGRKLESNPNVFECHNDLPKVYKCKQCDFASNLKVSLMHHLNVNHQEEPSNQNQFRNVLRQCALCGFQTYSTLVLLKHDDDCDGSEHLRSAEICKIIKWFECGFCSYKTRNEYCVTNHLKHQHSTKYTSFQCDKCPFKTKDIKWFKCDKCLFKSKEKECLRRHKLVKHSDNRNSFEGAYKDYLKKHNITTNVVPIDPMNIVWYHCGKCEYKATRMSLLRQHYCKRVHTSAANIVWHRCGECEFKSECETLLKKHIINVHLDSNIILWYHCDKCKYKTTQEDDFKQHIADVHMDSDNNVWHQCDKCPFKTSIETSFRIHVRRKHAELYKSV